MFRNTFTSLAWVCVFALASVGTLHSCALLDTSPKTPQQYQIVSGFEAEAAAIAEAMEKARADNDPVALLEAEEREAELTQRWAEYDAQVVREKVGPLGKVLGGIHPALGALGVFGVNAAAALATKRGRKHAWNAVRNFSPGSNATGDPWKPVEGAKDLGRMLGWLHSSKATEVMTHGATTKSPPPPPPPA